MLNFLIYPKTKINSQSNNTQLEYYYKRQKGKTQLNHKKLPVFKSDFVYFSKKLFTSL
jgi:hypothetical protein